MKILADIGGTYARFAVSVEGALRGVRKMRAEDFDSFDAALENFCHESGIERATTLLIATAGYEDEGLWKFVNKNTWQIDPEGLKKKGWDVRLILNDFEAATWALLMLENSEKKILREGAGQAKSYCMMGPGTGLGLGFLHQEQTPFIQKTHGGHMPAAAITDEQRLVMQTVQRLKKIKVAVYENLVSGPGLYNIYSACCMISGKPVRVTETEKLPEHKDDHEVKAALRLFHEFMGLFAANAVVTGNAYGGLYLMGGVLDRLDEHGLFDFDQFEQFFNLEVVASVRRDLKSTPITRITMPYPALKGLLAAEGARDA